MTFTCPSVRTIKSGFEFTNVGRIAKIRGIAYALLHFSSSRDADDLTGRATDTRCESRRSWRTG